MTTVIDNLMECVTVEIMVKRSNKVLISCVYRTSECCTGQFNKLYKKHNDKVIYVCGDFNIDVLKCNDNMKTCQI